jgi:hypothetical protein
MAIADYQGITRTNIQLMQLKPQFGEVGEARLTKLGF